MRKNLIIIALLVASSLTIISCSKDARMKPSVTFKTNAGYLTKDTTLGKSTAFTIGIDVKKTEDELQSYTASSSFDGGTKANIENTSFKIFSKERDGFEKTHNLTTRNAAGTEKYEFTVSDADGNINSISLMVTVK